MTGYSSIHAQLLSVPPYAVAAVVTVAIGFLADRTRQRGLCNIGVSILGIVGFSMLLGCESAGGRYAGVFLGAMGIYPAISNTIAWASNNTEGRLHYSPGGTGAATDWFFLRCVQARRDSWLRYRLGKPEWDCLV